jgi:hypothetical protein
MKYNSIADIYSANQKIREHLRTTLESISEAESTALPEGEKWSIVQIVEHLSMVGIGASRICSRLLEGARATDRASDGSFALSDNFGELAVEIAGLKVDAPERVQPTGDVSIGESIQRLNAATHALDSLRDDLERLDVSDHKFPHPFFGDLTAAEWLVIVGLHEQRHTNQIERLLDRIRQ